MMNNNKIHVAHVLYSFSTGGLENGVVNIINRLPEDMYMHSIVCVTDFDETFYERIKTSNTKIYKLNKPQGLNITWLWKCWKLLHKLKPDICHTRNLSALEAQLAALFSGVKFRIHGEHGWDVTDLGGQNTKFQKLRSVFRPFIHKYVALSKETKLYLIDKVGVKESRIKHICNGVDINKFEAKKCKAHFDDFNIQNDDIVFGTVGRLADVKNQTFLVEAFDKLLNNYPECRQFLKLIIVGDGVLMPVLKSYIISNQLESNVLLAGRRDDIAQCMQSMDIFVLPSLAEGISNTLLEAMATGLPIIATNVGGNCDLMPPEHFDSHLVDVNDVEQLCNAMSIYVENKSLIEEDSVKAREHCVNNFSIKHMVGKYHELYQSAEIKGT